MLCGRYLVTVILSVLSILSEHGLMGTANGTSIECASDSDFTFKFYSKSCAKSITIAECDLGKEECMMLATTHENKYSVMYTRRGGVLRIKDLDEETVGTYQCYETFNPFNVVSTHILLADYKSPMENCIGNSLKTTGGGRTDKYGHIVMGTLTNTSLECSSNVGLTFRFFSNILPSPVTIAECDFTTESCIMLQTTFKNKFDVFYTGRAGVLYIASLDDETIGEYRCCETFNPTNFISVDINLPYRNDVVNTTYGVPKATESINVLGNGLQKNETQNGTIIMVVGLIAFFLFGLIAVVIGIKNFVLITNKKGKSSIDSTTTGQAETDQLSGVRVELSNQFAELIDPVTQIETDGYDSGYASSKIGERKGRRKNNRKFQVSLRRLKSI